MSENNEYIYRGVELLTKINENSIINIDANSPIHLVCYHINDKNLCPFMQFMLLRSNNLILPILHTEQETLHSSIVHNVYNCLSYIEPNNLSIDNITVTGFYNYNNTQYIFVDISKITIDTLLLEQMSSIWFALPSEIINSQHICNISISRDITDFFINNPDFYTLCNSETNINYPIPDVVYKGSYIKKTLFQSVFGISKYNGDYGNCYYFKSSFENALKEGGWNIDFTPEYKYDKLITDNEFGRYISGGINRICLLLNNTIHISLTDTPDLQIEDKINIFDSVTICSKDEDPIILVKDHNQQIQLSYHTINKKTLGEKWEKNAVYSIY